MPTAMPAMVTRMFRMRDDGLLELDYDPAIVRTVSPLLLRLMRPLLWRAWRKLGRCGPLLVLRGANPDKADHVAGMSARDYAKRDDRTGQLLSILDAKPDAPGRQLGPTFGPSN